MTPCEFSAISKTDGEPLSSFLRVSVCLVNAILHFRLEIVGVVDVPILPFRKLAYGKRIVFENSSADGRNTFIVIEQVIIDSSEYVETVRLALVGSTRLSGQHFQAGLSFDTSQVVDEVAFVLGVIL